MGAMRLTRFVVLFMYVYCRKHRRSPNFAKLMPAYMNLKSDYLITDNVNSQAVKCTFVTDVYGMLMRYFIAHHVSLFRLLAIVNYMWLTN